MASTTNAGRPATGPMAIPGSFMARSWPSPPPIVRGGVCYPLRPVANIKSQIKRNRQNERHRLRNKAARSEIKTRIKNAVQATEEGAETSVETLRLAVKRL